MQDVSGSTWRRHDRVPNLKTAFPQQLFKLAILGLVLSLDVGHARQLAASGATRQAEARSLSSSDVQTCLYHAYTQPVTNYTWFSQTADRQSTQVSHGNQARLRVAMERHANLKAGENLTVVVLGGSISAGQGAVDGKAFAWWAEEILQDAMGPNVHIHNGAVPGTLSSYMSACHNVHVPKEADIILVDYSVNDDYRAQPMMDNPVRRPFERLLRKLLNYPRHPAVILVHSFVWHRVDGPSGVYWASSERDFHNFAMFYGIPELSVKAGAWRLMQRGVEGYQVDRTRADHHGRFQAAVDHEVKGKVFYWDIIHPDGQTGHRFMGEMVAQALLDAWAGVKARPVTDDERASVAEPLPPPMLPDNWESSSDKCFIGPSFVGAVIDSAGWEYKDEGKDPTKPKYGFISDTPGTVLKIKINTESSIASAQKLPVTVELSHLKSYVNMGRAKVSCISGCTCDVSTIEGHHVDKTSQLDLHEFKASQHPECIIAIEVLPDSSVAGHHKVKIAAVIVSEESAHGINNWAAVSMVLEGANKGGKEGTFDIRQWGRL